MPQTEPRHFVRDPSAAASLAAQFGAGAGTAEQLIEANSLRYTQELTAAQMQPVNVEATRELDKAQVAELGGLEGPQDVLDVAVRGNYVVFVAADSTGRTYKDVLLYNEGDLEAPEGEGSGDPLQRARLQAAVQGAQAIAEAREEADKIILEAQQKAQEMISQAAQESAQQEQETLQDAASDDESEGAPVAESDDRPPEGAKQQRQHPGQKSAGKPGTESRGGVKE